MSYNVFGNPITNETLEALPEYAGKEIQRVDRAHIAFKWMNAENKNVEAQKYVDALKEEYGNGVSTKCLFYNAVGNSITLQHAQDWRGKLGSKPIPITIQNGQWGGFLHVKPSIVPAGSAGAVVYRGMNNDGRKADFMCSWSNPWVGGMVRAYTEIKPEGYFVGDRLWEDLYSITENAGRKATAEWNGCKSSVIVGEGTTVDYVGILTLDGAETRLIIPEGDAEGSSLAPSSNSYS